MKYVCKACATPLTKPPVSKTTGLGKWHCRCGNRSAKRA